MGHAHHVQLEELRLAQDCDAPVRTKHGQGLSFRYAYARSTDTRSAQDLGQDYLVCRYGERAFLFALCDGVGQSFFGDLAARFLGDALLAWLEDDLDPTADEATIQSALTTHLHKLTGPATALVEAHGLPATLPPLVQYVLEESRQKGGSQTTFVCGRIDRPDPALPEGRAVLAWMGDSRLRIWGRVGERSAELRGGFDSKERWSSLRGPVGRGANVFVAALMDGDQPAITRVAAYSDGLASLDGYASLPPDPVIQKIVADAAESATSDDISFLEVWPEVPPEQNLAPAELVPQLASAGPPSAKGDRQGAPEEAGRRRAPNADSPTKATRRAGRLRIPLLRRVSRRGVLVGLLMLIIMLALCALCTLAPPLFEAIFGLLPARTPSITLSPVATETSAPVPAPEQTRTVTPAPPYPQTRGPSLPVTAPAVASSTPRATQTTVTSPTITLICGFLEDESLEFTTPAMLPRDRAESARTSERSNLPCVQEEHMDTAIVTIRPWNSNRERDLEIPVHTEAGRLSGMIAKALGLTGSSTDAEPSFGLRLLLPDGTSREMGRAELLSEAGVCDGATLELGPVAPPATESHSGEELAYRIDGKALPTRPLSVPSSAQPGEPGPSWRKPGR